MTDDSFGYSRSTATESLSPNGHKGQPPESGITLEQYAAAKRLPVDFLQSLNLKTTNYDFQPAVRIPYPNDLGKEVYHRYRIDLKTEPRFKAPPKTLGLQPIPYGLQVLADAREAGYAWLVEGESDAQVFWFIDQPAIGIPGVQAWAKFGREWAGYLQDIPMLLVPVEADSGGEQLWTLLSSTEDIRDRLCRVGITTPELKDIGTLWEDAADNGTTDKLKSAIEGQVYLQSRSRSLNRNGIGTESIFNPVQSVRAVSFTGRSRPKPREWIVDKAIPKGHATSWYGQGGVAKSFLATYLALSVASPEITEWGGQPTTTVPVIYGDFELDENEYLNRTLELVAGLGLDDVPLNFNYLGLTGLPSREALAIAAEECRRLGAGLFILDSVGYALAGDSEMSRDVIKFFRQEIQAIKNTGATPLLIDHQAKVVKGEKYSDKQEFGSVYKTNSVRSSFQLRGAWDANTMTATFTHKKHNLGPAIDPFSLMLTFEDGLVRVERLGEAIPDPDKQPTAREKVLEAAKKLGEGTTQDFAEESGVELKTVKNKVTELVDDGYLIDTGRTKDRYRIYAFGPGPNPNKGSGSGPKDARRHLRVVDHPQEPNTVVSEPNPTMGMGTYTFVDNTKALQRVVEEISSTTDPIALDTETSSLQVWASPARADTLPLRDPSFFHSILLEIRGTPVAKRRVQPTGVVEGL